MTPYRASGDFYATGEEIDYASVLSTHLVGVDRGYGQIFCCSCPLTRDGTIADKRNRDYVIANVSKWLDRFSYRGVQIRTDGEPVLLQLMNALKRVRTHPTDLQQTPTRSHQSLGAGERGVRTI